jgi:hypothetical protein
MIVYDLKVIETVNITVWIVNNDVQPAPFSVGIIPLYFVEVPVSFREFAGRKDSFPRNLRAKT